MSSFGELLPDVGISPPAAGSRALAGRLGRVESRNVTHVSASGPVFWAEALGANVRDVDGNVYLDLTSAFGVALSGHGNPRITEAVARQMGRLVHGMGDVHPPALKVELMERLAAHAPWPDARAVLASTGSEAVEVALKTALIYTDKPGVVAFRGGYHGLTAGALAVTDRPLFRGPFEAHLYGGVGFAEWPDSLRRGPSWSDRCLQEVEAFLRDGVPDEGPEAAGGPVPVGAVILEPVQGRGGVRVPPDGFLQTVGELAHSHGALVIADEVFTGMGRCGRPLVSGRLGLRPDVVCLGKALGGGFPVSACLGRPGVMDAWPASSGEAVHTSTFLGHPASCAAALTVLDMLDEGLADDAEEVGARLHGRLRDALDGVDGVGEVRGVGALIGIALVDAEGLPLDGAAVRVAEVALEKGVIVLPAGDRGHVVQLAPPASLTWGQIDFSVDTLHAVVGDVLGTLLDGSAGPPPHP